MTIVNNTVLNVGSLLKEWISGALITHSNWGEGILMVWIIVIILLYMYLKSALTYLKYIPFLFKKKKQSRWWGNPEVDYSRELLPTVALERPMKEPVLPKLKVRATQRVLAPRRSHSHRWKWCSSRVRKRQRLKEKYLVPPVLAPQISGQYLPL